MEKVIATIVIIVLTLGLISYAVIGQMGGFRDTADIVNEEPALLFSIVIAAKPSVPAIPVIVYFG